AVWNVFCDVGLAVDFKFVSRADNCAHLHTAIERFENEWAGWPIYDGLWFGPQFVRGGLSRIFQNEKDFDFCSINCDRTFIGGHISPQLPFAGVSRVDQKSNCYESQNPSADGKPLFWSSIFQPATYGMQWILKNAVAFAAMALASVVALGGATLLLGILGDGGILPSILVWLGCLWI